jgi:hypothetical protein
VIILKLVLGLTAFLLLAFLLAVLSRVNLLLHQMEHILARVQDAEVKQGDVVRRFFQKQEEAATGTR